MSLPAKEQLGASWKRRARRSRRSSKSMTVQSGLSLTTGTWRSPWLPMRRPTRRPVTTTSLAMTSTSLRLGRTSTEWRRCGCSRWQCLAQGGARRRLHPQSHHHQCRRGRPRRAARLHRLHQACARHRYQGLLGRRWHRQALTPVHQLRWPRQAPTPAPARQLRWRLGAPIILAPPLRLRWHLRVHTPTLQRQDPHGQLVRRHQCLDPQVHRPVLHHHHRRQCQRRLSRPRQQLRWHHHRKVFYHSPALMLS
mmetsp:Transcript_52318/g.124871  ORF Transcript_52318/g.124871 Transcript_52318/m.124871 type:complete len:252 (-) Transcript_52318:1042-1797(-)